ncbi:hypothetical protein BGZ70_008836 [Mortierella alpina]|uniref:Thymocyte nuclear protein 1 n=1 Tax=Mortierella alpina TaxID=64518 RepID=A0A9P6M5V2_MORAP|nr:hypothetical protein BGZ70_008836 [Mortierella alpina]
METRSKRRAPQEPSTSTTEKGPEHVASKVGAKRVKAAVAATDKKPSPAKKPKTKDLPTKDAPVSATETLNEDGSRTSVWLMKSEPDTFSIDDLIKSKDSTSHWDGVRNHEAKNLMKNSMKVGDQVLFYHSNTKEPGIVALAKIVRESYPDHTAFDPKSPYYDEKSLKEDPRWFMVDVQYVRKLRRILTLKELQQYKDKELCHMKLLNRGRLSVQPVSDAEMKFLMDLEEKEIDDSA